MVREKWCEKSGSRNLVREKWLTRKKRSEFEEPLFYTFPEMTSQNKRSTNYLLPTFLDNDGKILPGNRLECLEEGINYIRKNEEAEFATINQVDSADLCREICYVVDECFHWTWNKEKSSCHLKSEILKTGFR